MFEQKPEADLALGGFSAAVNKAIGIQGVWVLKVVGAVLATALAAQVSIGGPVPITLQTLAVLLTGFALGWRLAPAAMLLYVILGTVGLPVFAVGRLGLTGGYLIGFVFAALLVGYFGRGGRGSLLRTVLVAVAGTVTIFAFGLMWLAYWLEGDFSAVLLFGFVPHWPGALLKIAMTVTAVHGWRFTVAGLGKRGE
ncbi:MAG: biotin transporter BioY [Phycisphaerae bacterium]|nr:biotin transporter BioY [Phycisphaerae bacterium]